MACGRTVYLVDIRNSGVGSTFITILPAKLEWKPLAQTSASKSTTILHLCIQMLWIE